MPSEESYIESPGSYTLGDKQYTVFKTNGERSGLSDFHTAFDQFATTGKTPEGFTVLDEQSLKTTMRRGFEAVNQPIQQDAELFDKAFMGLANLGRRAIGKQPVDPSEIGFAAHPMRNITSTFDTPEEAGVTAALSLLGPALSGAKASLPVLSKGGGLFRRVVDEALGIKKTVARIAAPGIVAGTSAATAQELFGSAEQKTMRGKLETPLKLAIAIGSGELGFGAVKVIANSVPQNAREKLARVYVDILKKQGVGRNAQALDVIASTPEGLREITQKGIKVFRDSIDDLGDGFIKDINSTFPRSMKTGTTDKVKNLTKEYFNLSNKRLDHIGDEVKVDEIFSKMQETADKIATALKDDFSSGKKSPMGTDDIVKKIRPVFLKYQQQDIALHQAAELLYHMRQSGAEIGFDPSSFQKTIADKYFKGGDLLRKAGKLVEGQMGKQSFDIPRAVRTPSILGIADMLQIPPQSQ